MTQLVNILAEYSLYLGIPLALLAIVAWVYRPSAKNATRPMGIFPSTKTKKLIKHVKAVVDNRPSPNGEWIFEACLSQNVWIAIHLIRFATLASNRYLKTQFRQ